jgi:hypothetical protein
LQNGRGRLCFWKTGAANTASTGTPLSAMHYSSSRLNRATYEMKSRIHLSRRFSPSAFMPIPQDWREPAAAVDLVAERIWVALVTKLHADHVLQRNRVQDVPAVASDTRGRSLGYRPGCAATATVVPVKWQQ